MSQEKKYIINSYPRHLRYLFIVNNDISIEFLQKIMIENQKYWGGRYNPIIPAFDNKIPIEYFDLINEQDPDYVFYQKNIDIEPIKEKIYPEKYLELNEHFYHQLKGVQCTYLLEQNSGKALLSQDGYLYKSSIKEYLPFYELNFGFQEVYSDEHELLHNYQRLFIDRKNADKINKHISMSNVIYPSLLSRKEFTYKKLLTKKILYDKLELVIADKNNQFKDLIYFWNRELYFSLSHLNINQLFITIQQLEILCIDDDFHTLLAALSFTNNIKVYSETISLEELEELVNKYLRTDKACVSYFIENHYSFPYEINKMGYHYIWHNRIPNKQLIQGGQGLHANHLPQFLPSIINNDQKWAFDLEIERFEEDGSRLKYIKLPVDLSVYGLIMNHYGRISKRNDLIVFTSNRTSAIEIKIPDQFSIVYARITARVENKSLVEQPIQSLYISDAGKRLEAFIKLFEYNWVDICQLMLDKFWVQLIKSESDFKSKESNIPKGKGIFNYLDLKKEYDLITKANGITVTQKIKKEDFELYIDLTLQYLIDKQGIFMGKKVKCQFCRSNNWYSYAELDNKINCKGCSSQISPQMETLNYYKISDIIRGNMLNSTHDDSKDFDGNYTVLKTLIDLKQGSKMSFLFAPSLEYKTKRGRKSDIDIAVIQDGSLILGEAKNDAKDFNKKEIESLAWLGNNLKPQKLILAYNKGKLNPTRIEELRTMLDNDCDIIEHKVDKPFYHFHGLRKR